jgi:hypothetical protein
MSETQEVTPEFVQYIKERDAAVEEAEKAKAELRETQCKLYDSILLTEELEKVNQPFHHHQRMFHVFAIYRTVLQFCLF